MKQITINGKEYTIIYSFDAVLHKETVQKMFKVLSGAYFVRQGIEGNTEKQQVANAMIDGGAEMIADIPHIVKSAFYAGLLEKNPQTEEEAHALMKQYMTENKLSYKALFTELRECMEDDGFFDLSGLTEMLQEMNGTPKKAKKVPQDHKKQTTTK